MADEAANRPISELGDRIYATLLPVPIICFIGALLTDISYERSGGNFLWINFSSWLLAAGLLFGALAGLALLIEIVRTPSLRRHNGGAQFGLLLAAWLVELINALVHARDGWTAVVPTGLLLSALGAILVLSSGALWQSFRYRRAGERP